ncbi:hypothetical protein NDU88_003168 [Pleurodeles waltl]|uniref:Uncharacterized protein n=1 Tax=Pleurodeles waltl TaxID=8319 RepID=A0AAV7PC67_PLEWA|nr:hypothetical protein NDU88_003168 [Pleurodeles waltl]
MWRCFVTQHYTALTWEPRLLHDLGCRHDSDEEEKITEPLPSINSWVHQDDLEILLDPSGKSSIILKEKTKNEEVELTFTPEVKAYIVRGGSEVMSTCLRREFDDVFTDTLRCLTNYVHKIVLKDRAEPVSYKVRGVRLA